MFFARKVLSKIGSHLARDEATIIIGARQTGKSTLLRHLHAELKSGGWESWFINLENFEYLRLLNTSPLGLFTLIGRPESRTRAVVFIDEFQYLDNPSNFIKLIHDEYQGTIKLVVSGSSAFYLDEKFTDSLAGRKRIFHLPTLDFVDFLTFKQREDVLEALQQCGGSPRNVPRMVIDDIEALQREYLVFGGYPAVVLAESIEEKKLLLEDIVSSYVKKDVYEAGIRKTTEFFSLFRMLASQTGGLVNKHELSARLGVSVSAVTRYLSTMQRCFHIRLLQPFAKNIRSELTKMPKVYFNDVGLRNYLVKHLAYEHVLSDGHMLENAVFRALTDTGSSEELHFWRTQSGNEIDFVLPDTNRAFEVKTNLRKFRKSKHKLFTQAYPAFSLTPITLKHADDVDFAYLPLWGLYC